MADEVMKAFNKLDTSISNINISSLAYSKIVLHAFRYPAAFIGGYLIGSKSSNTLIIMDILLVHHEIPIGPILESSADIMDKQLSLSNKIVGYYFGHDDSCQDYEGSYPSFIESVKANITANTGYCVVLELVDRLLESREAICLQTMGRQPITPSDGIKKLAEIVDALLEQNVQYRIRDFEDYLNSTGSEPADYLNSFLPAMISSISNPH